VHVAGVIAGHVVDGNADGDPAGGEHGDLRRREGEGPVDLRRREPRHQGVQPGDVPRAAAGELVEVVGALGDGELDGLAALPARGAEELVPAAAPVRARPDAAEQRVERVQRGGEGGDQGRQEVGGEVFRRVRVVVEEDPLHGAREEPGHVEEGERERAAGRRR